jgi:hypothetical protein
MKKIWLSIPFMIFMNSGCSATIRGMQIDALNASNWTHQQMDNARRTMNHSSDR